MRASCELIVRAMSEEITKRFSKLGLADAKIKEIFKNDKVAHALDEIAQTVESLGGDNSKSAPLHGLASLSKDCPEKLHSARRLIVEGILCGDIKSNLQLDSAWKYVCQAGSDATKEGINDAAGVGVVVTDDTVREEVAKYIEENKADIEEKRYKAVPSVIAGVKSIPSLKWANPASFKPIIDEQILKLLGPKDDRDLTKPSKGTSKAKQTKKVADSKKKGDNDKVDGSSAASAANARSMFSEGFLGALHKPGENTQLYPERMKEHLAFTHGRVFTRFPPEPNGYLHIGHSKAIAINFGFAKFHGGECYLRFDDTNPEAEEEKYFTAIEDIVDWLGFKPYRITYSSDYFDNLYELAEQLIKKGLAYVCFCTAEEMKAYRGVSEDGSKGKERRPCPHRDTSPEKNLELFRAMRDGKYAKGEATLRMKQDLDNPNPQMWDLVAYRVLNASHHRTGDKWKIYPTYDFTHCLVDSMENISHSLCTNEFFLSRESYEWLCDALCVYKPWQRESGRLNLQGTITSKRKILKMVNEGIVRGWDDPRLFTLVGLRRRGVPPGAILNFIAQLGVTNTNSNIEVIRFDSSIRKYLENTVPRLMMILDPVLVVIDNLPDDYLEMISVPFKPGTPEFGEHSVPFTNRIYIDRSDFREGDASKDYFRLTTTQPVGLLKIPFNIRVNDVKKDANGNIIEIHVHYENDSAPKKPKTFIQWVADCPAKKSPVKLDEVRLFKPLFKSDNPLDNPDGYLADVNTDSEDIITGSIIETGFHEVKDRSPWKLEGQEDILSGNESKWAPETVRFQALRVGYFCMDKDSSDNKIVLNNIVSLKSGEK